MREAGWVRWPGDVGVRRVFKVGSKSLKVPRGSRQAPPWRKLGFDVCVSVQVGGGYGLQI